MEFMLSHLLGLSPLCDTLIAYAPLGSFAISLLVCLALMLTHLSAFCDSSGRVQDLGAMPSVRIGGLGIYVALFLVCILLLYAIFLAPGSLSAFAPVHDSAPRASYLASEGMLASLVASYLGLEGSMGGFFVILGALLVGFTLVFLSGFLEDVFGCVTPPMRMGMQAFALAIILLATTPCLVVFSFDLGFVMPYALAFVVTIFMVTGIINSINIIDGLNALSSLYIVLALLALIIVAKLGVGDSALASEISDFVTLANLLDMSALGYGVGVVLSAILAFVALNLTGRIYLGDGGAYLLGAIASLALIYVVNSLHISAFFALDIFIYPFYETIFSMYRRHKKGRALMQPDASHLHSLLFTYLLARYGTREAKHGGCADTSLEGRDFLSTTFDGKPVNFLSIPSASPSQNSAHLYPNTHKEASKRHRRFSRLFVNNATSFILLFFHALFMGGCIVLVTVLPLRFETPVLIFMAFVYFGIYTLAYRRLSLANSRHLSN